MKTIEKYIDCIKTNVLFKVGGNAAENHQLIGDSAPNDIWFHIADYSSCHVVADISNLSIEMNKKAVAKIVTQGAALCKQFSRQKSDKNVAVIYTKIENVTPTSTPGQVTTLNTKTITI
jgi:predicted ribosome quality control (RQC) complex YloA/Tae2 family protein